MQTALLGETATFAGPTHADTTCYDNPRWRRPTIEIRTNVDFDHEHRRYRAIILDHIDDNEPMIERMYRIGRCAYVPVAPTTELITAAWAAFDEQECENEA